MTNCLFVNFMFTFILMQFLTILKTNSCAETEESLMDDHRPPWPWLSSCPLSSTVYNVDVADCNAPSS